MTSEAKPAISLRKKLIVVLVMIASLALTLFSPTPFLSKEVVEQQLKFTAETLANYAQENGSDANFSYGEVEISGLAYEKQAKVMNPSLTFTRGNWGGNNKITVSSPYMLIIPQAVGALGITIEFPEPLSVSENGGPASTMAFEGGSPVYRLSKAQSDGAVVFSHILKLPPAFMLTPANDNDGGTHVSYDENPTLELLQFEQAGSTKTQVNFQNVSIVDPKTTITFAHVASTLERKPVEGGKMSFDSIITVNDIGYKRGDELDGPYSIKFSATGTRVAAVDGKLPPPDTNITLREFLLTADQFRLSATGAIGRTADDFMPFGKADVKVENFSNLRNSNSLSPELKAAIVETASRITGEDAAASDTLSFAIERQKMGDITVGKAPFEEVLATFLSRMMLGGEAPAQMNNNTGEGEDDAPVTDTKPAT